MPENPRPLPDFTRWPSFPFEGDLRVKDLAPPVEEEPPRSGEDASDCVACQTPDDAYIWVSERWRVRAMDRPTGLPVVLVLECRSHLDIGDLPNLLAAELGVMTVRLERAVRSLDGVARVHVNRWGDGAAHLHMWFLARPYGRLQLRGTFLTLWDDILPVISESQWQENLGLVAAWLAEFGGRAIAEPPHIAWQSPGTISTALPMESDQGVQPDDEGPMDAVVAGGGRTDDATSVRTQGANNGKAEPVDNGGADPADNTQAERTGSAGVQLPDVDEEPSEDRSGTTDANPGGPQGARDASPASADVTRDLSSALRALDAGTTRDLSSVAQTLVIHAGPPTRDPTVAQKTVAQAEADQDDADPPAADPDDADPDAADPDAAPAVVAPPGADPDAVDSNRVGPDVVDPAAGDRDTVELGRALVDTADRDTAELNPPTERPGPEGPGLTTRVIKPS